MGANFENGYPGITAIFNTTCLPNKCGQTGRVKKSKKSPYVYNVFLEGKLSFTGMSIDLSQKLKVCKRTIYLASKTGKPVSKKYIIKRVIDEG